ncbi:hypothetical protein PRIPAC_90654 [Pristionchus pacificus]|uniref:Uncharacterized protein n=1 Tax=Pristionchus pacificus TaxID=54126 RepID=A0A2A6CYN0_PRIPA|nr:hypothetical protein PRIPAC_90654 [Pristionchus pacificus]|eukprot:PDM83131.1 hypothetical protein PRIPAC_37524 [Pristionchus pacificus]
MKALTDARKTALKVVLSAETEHVIGLHAVLDEHSNADKTTEKGISFEETARSGEPNLFFGPTLPRDLVTPNSPFGRLGGTETSRIMRTRRNCSLIGPTEPDRPTILDCPSPTRPLTLNIEYPIGIKYSTPDPFPQLGIKQAYVPAASSTYIAYKSFSSLLNASLTISMALLGVVLCSSRCPCAIAIEIG